MKMELQKAIINRTTLRKKLMINWAEALHAKQRIALDKN